MSREVTEHPIPPSWQMVQFNPEGAAQVYEMLRTIRLHLQAISRIDNYEEAGEVANYSIDRLLCNQELRQDLRLKYNQLKDIAGSFISGFEEVQAQQRRISLSFIRIARDEMERNINRLGRVPDEPSIKKDQYFLYVQQSLLQSLTTLRYFVQQQRDVSREYCETKDFLRRVMPERYISQMQQGEEAENRNLQSALDDNPNEPISHEFNILLGQVQYQLNRLQQAIPQQQSSCWQPTIIMAFGLLLLAACLGVVVYSFSIFDDYSRLRIDQLGWEGAGAYLIYLWLNYWLANICQGRQIDVLLGTGCKSPLDILFLSSRFIFLLLGLTLIYLMFLAVYLLWINDNIVCRIMNGLILGLSSAELVYRVYKMIQMRNVEMREIEMRNILIPAFASKLSLLHFLTIFLPINDIIGSLFVLQRNENMASIIYLVFLFFATCFQQKRKNPDADNSWTFLSICALISFLAELVFVFLDASNSGTKEKLLWVCIILNILTLCCFTVSKADPLSPRQFFIDIKTIFTCCYATDADTYRLRMDQANSYSRLGKALLSIIAISFLIILPSGIHWQYMQPYIGLHRYIYVAVLMGAYFAWSILYLTEVSNNLKHPLGNCTRLLYSLALLLTIPLPPHNQTYFDLDALDRREEALKNLNQTIEMNFSLSMEILRNVVAQLEDNTAYGMVAP